MRLGTERDQLSVVSDQQGTPTYADDLAQDLLLILSRLTKDPKSLNTYYNYTQLGHTNWAAYAQVIMDHISAPCKINAIDSQTFGAPAPRPRWSVMSVEKIQATFGIKLRPWTEAVASCIDHLRAMK